MSYVIYQETWEDRDGYRFDIAFTEYEVNKMPVEYRISKHNALAKQYGFNIAQACRIREQKVIVKDPEEV